MGLLFELALRDELSLSPDLQAEIHYRAGRRHYYRAEWFLAIEYYEQALKLFREIGDKLGEANVRKAIGDVQQFRDDRDAALASYEQALKLFREIGDKLGEANVLQAIGDVQQFRDDRDAALASYEQALKLFREIGAKLGEANTLQSMGRLDVQNATNQTSFQKGMETLQTAMALYEDIHDKTGQINILMFSARIMAYMNQNEKALEIARAVLPMLVDVAGENHPVTISFREFIKGLQSGVDEKSGENEIEKITKFVQVIVRSVLEKRENASELFEAVSRMAVDSDAPPHYQELGNVLKKYMSGIRNPDLSRLPKEIAEIVRKAIQEG